MAHWVRAYQLGTTNGQIVAGFVGSQEYYQKHSANARDWLFGAYQDLLARKPDQAGYNNWLGVLRALPR